MIPSQSFGSCRAGSGAENGRRPGEGQCSDRGQDRQPADRSMRVSHIDVTMLNSSPTASCKFRQTKTLSPTTFAFKTRANYIFITNKIRFSHRLDVIWEPIQAFTFQLAYWLSEGYYNQFIWQFIYLFFICDRHALSVLSLHDVRPIKQSCFGYTKHFVRRFLVILNINRLK